MCVPVAGVGATFEGMTDPIIEQIRRTVARELSGASSVLLAVSGGIDSMVLLDAAASVRPESVRVATFDHATGPYSARAVDLVQRVALRWGLPVTAGGAYPGDPGSEATWRAARLTFLRHLAEAQRSVICTAHNRDDQIETVLFRVMRGAGTRGLAGLRAAGPMLRPLLDHSREEIDRYAAATRVEWIEDPTNAERRHARNRLRHDILPALRITSPDLDAALIDVGERAAQWRADVDDLVDAEVDFLADIDSGMLMVAVASLRGRDSGALAILWPALLGRIGIAADWRGTRRLVEFTKTGTTNQRIQLSGGWGVFRGRKAFEVFQEGEAYERYGLVQMDYLY
jgi:tRNA(Ile)-lysidine synthase